MPSADQVSSNKGLSNLSPRSPDDVQFQPDSSDSDGAAAVVATYAKE
jgi:hypothetical protein